MEISGRSVVEAKNVLVAHWKVVLMSVLRFRLEFLVLVLVDVQNGVLSRE